MFSNIDAQPGRQLLSVDLTAVFGDLRPSPAPAEQVRRRLRGALMKEGSAAWRIRTVYTPIIDLTYGNGAHQGQGFMDIERTPLVISGHHPDGPGTDHGQRR